MEATVSINKHPVHPMLVSFPIAFFALSLFGDFMFYGNYGQTPSNWLTVANYSMGLGIVAALVAAVPGVIDMLGLPSESRARKLAYWHMSLNLSVVAYYCRFFISLGTGTAADAQSERRGIWHG